MPCNHPLSALKPEDAEQSQGRVTIRFRCTACLVKITKEFMLAVPEPEQSAVSELLDAADGTPAPARARRGENSPWRTFVARA